MHRLVFHFPAGVGAFHDVDDAGSVALVGIIIHGEAVAELVEGDFLGIAQAEVNHFEVRTIGLKTEDGATVMRVVFLTFLGGEVEAAVADGTPDAAVRADGEAVHIMAGKRDAHTEAFFDDLALRGDAVVLGVLQHPELRDAGEVDVIVPRHHAGAGAVEDVVELVAEDLLGRESAVGLLAAHVADDFGLGRHPFNRLLGLPLIVHGQAVGDGLGGKVVVVPEEVVTIVLDAETEAMGLRHVDATVVAEGDRGGRSDAGDLMVGGDLEARARDKGGAAFAGDAYEASIGLRLRAATLHKVRLGIGREDEVVGSDDPPRSHVVVDDADHGGLALELGDIPDGLAQGQVVGAGRLADDLARDDELDGGLARVIAAGDEEADVRMREFELGRSQGAGGGVAAVARADERVTAVVAELSVDAVDLAGDRRQAEAGAGGLPAVEAVAFEGLDDLGVRLEDGGAQAKGERSKQG